MTQIIVDLKDRMNHFQLSCHPEATRRPEQFDLHERGTFSRLKEVQQQETAGLHKHVAELKSIIEEKERQIGQLEAAIKEVRATEVMVQQAPTIIRMSDTPVTQVIYKTDPAIVEQNRILSQELSVSLVGSVDEGRGEKSQETAPTSLGGIQRPQRLHS